MKKFATTLLASIMALSAASVATEVGIAFTAERLAIDNKVYLYPRHGCRRCSPMGRDVPYTGANGQDYVVTTPRGGITKVVNCEREPRFALRQEVLYILIRTSANGLHGNSPETNRCGV